MLCHLVTQPLDWFWGFCSPARLSCFMLFMRSSYANIQKLNISGKNIVNAPELLRYAYTSAL
jgi:hypothetical protein